MIRLTRLNKKEYFLNSELIETIEATPDTVVTLIDGKKYVVEDSPEEILEKIIIYKKRIFNQQSLIINSDEKIK